jgi:hypothetical protein
MLFSFCGLNTQEQNLQSTARIRTTLGPTNRSAREIEKYTLHGELMLLQLRRRGNKEERGQEQIVVDFQQTQKGNRSTRWV